MAEGRWKYRTAVVTVGENSQKVRGLTAGERRAFAEKSKAMKAAGEGGANMLPNFVVQAGAVDPTLTDEDVDAMPPDLLDACSEKVFELTGADREKKEKVSDPS